MSIVNEQAIIIDFIYTISKLCLNDYVILYRNYVTAIGASLWVSLIYVYYFLYVYRRHIYTELVSDRLRQYRLYRQYNIRFRSTACGSVSGKKGFGADSIPHKLRQFHNFTRTVSNFYSDSLRMVLGQSPSSTRTKSEFDSA